LLLLFFPFLRGRFFPSQNAFPYPCKPVSGPLLGGQTVAGLFSFD